MLVDIELLNPHRRDKSFKNKIEKIKRTFDRQAAELNALVAVKMYDLDKGLSAERIEQFHQFEADESYVGDQC